ncbi:MAG: DUF481 domain-containing protein [Candidatus Rifleibacteriota bacterium]
MYRLVIVAITLFLLVLSLNTVHASSPEGRLSLGYTDTSGNTDEEQLNFDFNLKEKKNERLNFLYNGLFYYGKTNNEITADKKQLGVISEFVQDKFNSYYLETGYLKDTFAGYDSRYNAGLGYYRILIARDDMNLRAAAGIEITREDYTDNSSNTKRWLKFRLNGDRNIGENIKLLSSVNFGAPKNDYDERYEVDFSAGALFSVNSRIDLETRYIRNYRRSPLVAGKEKTDSKFITNLVYKM